jgi:gliding motility-associated protein GldM
MGQFTFRVRKLPDPTPYIPFKDAQGNGDRFRGGAMTKQQLMTADGIGAAIDDGILDIGFRVLSFETVFYDSRGNAVPLAGEGSHFSERQKDTFRKLQRNRRFYISRVVAVGPDGIQRQLNTTLEVIVR